ncbi:MAG: porin family protein [Sediminicola sp.]
MPKIWIILFLLMCFALHSQNGPKWLRLGVTLSSDYNISSQNIELGNYMGYTASYDRTNYSLGLQAEKFLTTDMSVNLGLQFSQKNFTGTFYCAVCDWAMPPNPETIRMQFLEIPIGVRKYFLPGKWKLFADVGLLNQIALKNDLETNSYLLSANVGGGTEYKIGTRWSLQLKAFYNRALTNTFEGSGHKMQFLAFGMGIMTSL